LLEAANGCGGGVAEDTVDGAGIETALAKANLERCNLGISGRECTRSEE
jgi:hypothetical protein